jgi:predicted acylesterase/phospholipase RssA
MKRYASDRRTAVVFHGTGAAGAYHAGALRALDEAGVRIDVLVGSGAGVIAAAFGAVAAGPALYAKDGLWMKLERVPPVQLRRVLRLVRGALIAAAVAFLVPAGLALLGGLLLPVGLLVDAARPGFLESTFRAVLAAVPSLRAPWLVALATPTLVALAGLAIYGFRNLSRRFTGRPGDSESIFTAERGLAQIRNHLWAAVRGPDVRGRRPSDAEIGSRYASLLDENLGQPGYREVILRVADLDASEPLSIGITREPARAGEIDGRRSTRHLMDAILTCAAVAPLLAPRRSPRGAGKVPNSEGAARRLADASAVGGCGVREAIASGATQIIVVSGARSSTRSAADPPPGETTSGETTSPAEAEFSSYSAGPAGLADAWASALDRSAIEQELEAVTDINRLLAALAPGAEWTDPSNERRRRVISVFVVRPRRCLLAPTEMAGSVDMATGALNSLSDWMERGRLDAAEQFLDPFVVDSEASREVARTGPQVAVAGGLRL